MTEQIIKADSRPYARAWIALLALLTALAPLSTDMYLPALPQMAQAYGVSTDVMANSLPAYFLGLALGQLLYGPLSDRFGRKKPLIVGLSVHIVATVLCVWAPDTTTLLVARVLQAIGGCVGMVIARAAIRDCLPTAAAAQAFASMMMVMGVAPVVAPTLGAWVLAWWDWQVIFGVLLLLGVCCLVWVVWGMDETLPEDKRMALTVKDALKLYHSILLDRGFLWPMLAGCFSFAVLFSYITAASSVLMEGFQLGQQTFAYVFGLNAVGTMALAACNHGLSHRFSVLQRLQMGGGLQLLGSVFLLVAAIWDWGLIVVMVGLFLAVSGIGLTAPNATALSMSAQGRRAGSASALMGSLQFGCGLLCGIVLNVLPFSALLNMACVMVVSVVLCGLVILKIPPQAA